METRKGKTCWCSSFRWLARLVCIGFVVFVHRFLHREGGLSDLGSLGILRSFYLRASPAVRVGTVVAFSASAGRNNNHTKRHGFNAVDMAAGSAFIGSFWIMLIPGAVFILLDRLTGNRRRSPKTCIDINLI